METGYSMRIAQKEDVDHVLRLIKEFAAFENKSHCVTIESKDLAEDLSSWYSCVVLEYRPAADRPPEAVGYVMWHYCYSTWVGRMAFLIHIYVTPDHRGRGCGWSLMQCFAKICYDKGCKRLRWTVESSNHPAKKLYDKMKARNMSETEDWEIMQVKGVKLLDLAQGTRKIPLL